MNRKNPIYIGDKKASFNKNVVKGEFVKVGDESFYKIANVDEMRPFFMSIVSNSNHWMFLASNGGLSAGRKNSDFALFPYYTDDKITEGAEITGSKTIIQLHLDDKIFLWEPFSNLYKGVYKISRNLYKNTFGNKVIFEEINHDLNVAFTYEWNSSDLFGFVKKSTLINNSNRVLDFTILDGIQNLIPYGVGEELQATKSNLVDAYKRCELETDYGLGIFELSAIIVDKAEPSEALKANIAWSVGIENPTYLLSSLQLDDFRRGTQLNQETDIKAEKGAYFISSDVKIDASASKSWMILADVNQTISTINALKHQIANNANLTNAILADIEEGTRKLVELTAASDGLQLTADNQRDSRHYSNTLFNIMRGGIFDENYNIEKADFIIYLSKANKQIFKQKESFLEQLPEVFSHSFLINIADNDDEYNFKRLCYEYMPLKFSRRHGDPSRPWNRFSINTRNEVDGSKILDYEGNWRDIFQNWEALAQSYPEFIVSMIHKFLNATTFDGYNPYRVTKGGFDWETIEPHDPWSYIGYWGDHQIIYLLKFLEFIEKHYPKQLENYFDKNVFVYANVPYKIKSYEKLLKNPKDTIDFDADLDRKINQWKAELGADGAILKDMHFSKYKVNLIEKLLATVLAKVSNFIPEGGIWLNTQRPEWNDANNALVGNGVSMVTLYYLRRFLKFFETILQSSKLAAVDISSELALFLDDVVKTLENNLELLNNRISDSDKKRVLDGVGIAGSNFRNQIYKNGFSNTRKSISKDDLLSFINYSLQFIDHSINANKRPDNLYHAYNLMTVVNDKEISISHLPEMLEGQVAILSAGYLTTTESLDLLNSLRTSALFRPDQYSYLLYPNKELKSFSEKNNIPAKLVNSSELLKQLLKDNNKEIVEQDTFGNYHFNGNFNNADTLKKALKNLPAKKYGSLLEKDIKLVLDIYEKIFDHKSFTGRSGTFFGYEGLGSIYWHMVSKLVLSIQETAVKAIVDGESEVVIGRLLDHYYEANEGLGVHKSPELYGAFPTDPYSHTPAGKGAQQPGMTGQVKEDIISRFGELGIFVKDGKLRFNTRLLRSNEFLTASKTFTYPGLNKEIKTLEIEKDSLCFTYCQVPFIYTLANETGVKLFLKDGKEVYFDTLSLDQTYSAKIFSRTDEVSHVIVSLKKQ
ncbi:MAG: hypothetical protein KGZ87_09500 [Bacteroidetes bacterium]|nr:hypothetical protein [Bacteroidota bacterium]